MSWLKESGPFIILVILGFWVAVSGIYDVVYNKGWMLAVFASYALIIIIALFLIFFRRKKEKVVGSVEEFEKSLSGELYHFKCPTCKGIFAIKKSKSNNKKYVKMTCPDCGAIGVIPPVPATVEAKIPDKKSMNVIFQCGSCGEGITIWAEGTDLYKDTEVYLCPFCGEADSMKKI